MGGRTFERKAPFATTSFKKGGGRIFEGGLIFGRLRYCCRPDSGYVQVKTLKRFPGFDNCMSETDKKLYKAR